MGNDNSALQDGDSPLQDGDSPALENNSPVDNNSPGYNYEALAGVIDSLPLRSGVYIFRNSSGKVLYVGKSVKLRARVRSYFTSWSTLTPGKRQMVSLISSIDFLVTANEAEALILEYELIRTHYPPYNIIFKDDKSYPMLKITNEEYPRLIVVRKRAKDGATYFGPYPDPKSVRLVAKALRSIFPLRKCKTSSKALRKQRVCLNYELGICSGPCAGHVDEVAYGMIVDSLRATLKGSDDDIVACLKIEMEKASAAYAYEKAAEFRDMIRAFSSLKNRQRVVSGPSMTCDVIAIARKGTLFCIQLLMIRGGRMVGERHSLVDSVIDDSREVLSRFISDSYMFIETLPPKLLVSVFPLDVDFLLRGFEERHENSFSITVPVVGKGKRLVDMALDNARMRLDVSADDDALDKAQCLLKLKVKPVTIECIDISISASSNAVGSLVVFKHGRSVPSLYRRFKIKSVEGTDDFAMMAEVVGRRYSRLRDDKGELPDLLIVDGGKGQVTAAVESLKSIGMYGLFPVLGLAKKEERIVGEALGQGVVLPKGNSLRMLFERIRDEAHRRAVGHHRILRKKDSLATVLDTVPGVGRVLRKALLTRFGDIYSISDATVTELCSVDGVGPVLARKLKEIINLNR